MDEMRVDVGLEESYKKKLIRFTWAGNVENVRD